MIDALRAPAIRFRVIAGRLLTRLGLGEESFLIVLAVLVGMVTAAAAVGFHELIDWVRNLSYRDLNRTFHLYGRHLWLLVLIPAVGGLVVGIVSRLVHRRKPPTGIVDVMESVGRSTGGVRPLTAIEKIFTSAVTIGSGGSAGAEGPIVTIGAAIASGVGHLFGIARQQMPVLIGCGTAAGISAIFNAPIGGVLFTLEVILQDFSIRTFTPVVLASVIANATTQEIFARLHPEHTYLAIFQMPTISAVTEFGWEDLPNFLLLGLFCGFLGMTLTRLMYFAERKFEIMPLSRALKPAVGGLALGVIGALYVMIFGWFLLDQQDKPVPFEQYPMPSFFGDGYGVVRQMLTGGFFAQFEGPFLATLLIFIVVAKIFGTCLTLGSGGSGGIIAPSLFIGAAGGGLLGVGLRQFTYFTDVRPDLNALIGMGAVLAAVVHAPLASILILFEVTRDPRIMLPAMLCTIVATGLSRLLFPDSIYTLALRRRGVRMGSSGDAALLRRLHVEQIDLEPATTVRASDPFQRVLDLIADTGASSFVVLDQQGHYTGMIVMEDIRTVLLEREAVPLLLVEELTRRDIPLVRHSDDLATVLDTFSRYDVTHLPVTMAQAPGRVIGLISRVALMRRYQRGLAESR